MAVRDEGKTVDRVVKMCACGVAALLIGVGITRVMAAQGDETQRPAISQRSGNTWCGIVTTAGGGDLMTFSRDLATYVDGGASVFGYVKDAKADHTALVCGPVTRVPK